MFSCNLGILDGAVGIVEGSSARSDVTADYIVVTVNLDCGTAVRMEIPLLEYQS